MIVALKEFFQKFDICISIFESRQCQSISANIWLAFIPSNMDFSSWTGVKIL